MTDEARVEEDLRALSITQLLEQISRRNARIAELQNELERARAQVQAADERSAQLADTIARAEADAERVKRELEAKLAAREESLQRITSSRGWRLLEAVRTMAPKGSRRRTIVRALLGRKNGR